MGTPLEHPCPWTYQRIPSSKSQQTWGATSSSFCWFIAVIVFWNFGFVSLAFVFMSRYSMDLCLGFGLESWVHLWKCISWTSPFSLSLELFWFTVSLSSADLAFKGGILSRDGALLLTPILISHSPFSFLSYQLLQLRQYSRLPIPLGAIVPSCAPPQVPPLQKSML